VQRPNGVNNADDLRAFHNCLLDTHTMHVGVSVLDVAGNPLGNVSERLISGQVTVDRKAPIASRALQVEFYDPHHALHFDSASPDDGAMFADRMLRVSYSVRVPELGRRVTSIPFTGPLTHFERRGDVVSVEAHGMEAFVTSPAWVPLGIKKSTLKTDAIRTLLASGGEDRFDFPVLAARLPDRVALNRHDIPWPLAQRISRSTNRQLFYPGTGVATMRHLLTRPVFTFATGDGGSILGEPSVSNTIGEDFANLVEVIGAKPKGSKTRVRYVATAPPSHPLSPRNLGRNGKRRFIPLRIENDHLRSVKECRTLAERTLRDRLRQTVEVACEVLPIPHLDEGDMVRYVYGGGSVTARLDQWVLPLHTDGDPTMTAGYIEDRMVRKHDIRRH
jgi:hypothetical protein